ncbi:MAG: hypothetical protein ACOCXG_00390 [Nanoarchaeota archaeon]
MHELVELINQISDEKGLDFHVTPETNFSNAEFSSNSKISIHSLNFTPQISIEDQRPQYGFSLDLTLLIGSKYSHILSIPNQQSQTIKEFLSQTNLHLIQLFHRKMTYGQTRVSERDKKTYLVELSDLNHTKSAIEYLFF